jgi:TatD DNase family protein
LSKKRHAPRPTAFDAYAAIDSHAHLDRRSFGDELPAVAERAFAHGVSGIVAIAAGDDERVFADALRLAEQEPRVRVVAGIHPHVAANACRLWGPLADALGHPAVVGIGELGLDFHYDFSPRPVQVDVMRRQLAMSRERSLPVVLHVREAFEEALRALDAEALSWEGVVHCFSGSWSEAEEYLKRGLHLSLPGIVTFDGSAELRAVAARIPLDRLLVETDSPYLAPVPFRGRRNEPALVAFVVAAVAAARGMSCEELASLTRENTRRLFRWRMEPAGQMRS